MYNVDVSITRVNGRTLLLRGSQFKEKKKNGAIYEIQSTDHPLTYTTGQIVTVAKSKQKVNIIQKLSHEGVPLGYYLSVANKTDSSIFVTPLILPAEFKFKWEELFVNTFVSTPDNERCVAILFRFLGTKAFVNYENAIRGLPEYSYTVDVDHHHVMYVFNITDEISESYDKFILGKYSELSPIVKLKILSFNGFDSHGHTGQILYKSSQLKDKIEEELDVSLGDCELHSIPNMNNESFNPKIYSTNE